MHTVATSLDWISTRPKRSYPTLYSYTRAQLSRNNFHFFVCFLSGHKIIESSENKSGLQDSYIWTSFWLRSTQREERKRERENTHIFKYRIKRRKKYEKKRSSNKTKQRETPTKHITCATGERIRETCYSFCLFLTRWLTMQRKTVLFL